MRVFSRILLIIMAVIILLTFVVGAFYNPAIEQSRQTIQVPVSSQSSLTITQQASSPASQASSSSTP